MPSKPENGVLFEPPEPEPITTPAGPTSRDLSRFIRYYCSKVKKHSASECIGVIRNIQRMIAKGITVESIALALENYAADPLRRNNDIRYTKHIRSFFKPEVIEEWQTPKPSMNYGLPEIVFVPLVTPVPVVPQHVEEESNEL